MRSLHLAADLGCRSIAFPSISTGVYGYPKPEAAVVSSAAIAQFLAQTDLLKQIRLVFYSKGDARVFLENHTFSA